LRAFAGVQRVRAVLTEDAGRGQVFQQLAHIRVVSELLQFVGRSGRRVVGVVPEVDASPSDHVVHLGRDDRARVTRLVATQREDQSRNVGQARVLQLVDIAIDASDKLREVDARGRGHIPECVAAEQEGHALALLVLELTSVVSEARVGRGLKFEPRDRTGQDTCESHALFPCLR
jgi:hypothetical protein